MRFTSLLIELIRARPRLVVWVALLAQAVLWLSVMLTFYDSPPPSLALTLAYGREYQVGTELGPPLAPWLADIAYRAAGNHMFGVYLLAELCSLASLWILFLLGRMLVGSQHAVLAVLLTMTVTAFGAPTLQFGPEVLARPLWALLLLHGWELIGRGQRNVWFAWSIAAGLLLLTTSAAAMLLAFIAAFSVANTKIRPTLRSVDLMVAILMAAALALPYVIFVMRTGLPGMSLPAPAALGARAALWGWLVAGLVVALAGILILVGVNSLSLTGTEEDAPFLYRPPVEPLARQFVYFFAVAPPLAASLGAAFFGLDRVVGGTGLALMMAGPAVVVASGDLIRLRHRRLLRAVWAGVVVAPVLAVVASTLVLPWTDAGEVKTSLPAREIAQFFTDSFQRRTNQRLPAVAGDPEIASLIAAGPTRPHLFNDAAPHATPWMSLAGFDQTGGVVVWRASDTAGSPPPEIARRFKGLAPEVPRSFDRLVNGQEPTLRIGWAIVRPKGS